MEVRRPEPPGHQAGPPGGELTIPAGKRRGPPRSRLACYAIALAVALPLAWRSGRPNDPAVDIAALVEVAATGSRSSFRSGGASLFVTSHGWTLSVYTGAARRYEADFLVVRRQDGALSVDLITDPQAAGHVATARRTAMPEVHLAGRAAAEYLAKVELEVDPFDALAGRSGIARADAAAPGSR